MAFAPKASAVPFVPFTALLSPPDARIAVRRSVVADEYFWLRGKLLDGETPTGYAEAMDAVHELHVAFSGDATAWEDLEVPLGSVEHASELEAAYGALPEATSLDGRIVRLRELALRLGRALASTETAYAAGPYVEHHASIVRAAEVLRNKLKPKESELLAALESDLVLAIPERRLTLTLVFDAPYPGSFAADARGHEVSSFVRVRGLEGAALVEVVLQQYLHTLDELTVRANTLQNELRAAFSRRGIDATDPGIEMAVNTVTFAESASLVRRFVDPSHIALAEGGFFAFYPPALGIVETWKRRVAGQSPEATVESIVDVVTKVEPGAEPEP